MQCSNIHVCTSVAELGWRNTYTDNHVDCWHFQYMATNLNWTLNAARSSPYILSPSLLHSLRTVVSKLQSVSYTPAFVNQILLEHSHGKPMHLLLMSALG